MALKHVKTSHKGLSSNFKEIYKDFQDEMKKSMEKTKDFSITIANDVPYGQWVKFKGSEAYWYQLQLEKVDVRIKSLKLPLHLIFNRRYSRADVVKSVVNKLDKYVMQQLQDDTPFYSGQLSFGTASADPSKIDKRYKGPYLGWYIVGPDK